MSGRNDNDRKIEEHIDKILRNQPEILQEYSYAFIDKTSNTKYVYLLTIIWFVNYMKKVFYINFDDIYSIDKITYKHVNAFMNYAKTHSNDGAYIKRSASNCAMIVYALKHFCEFLMYSGYIENNPCIYIKAPKDKKIHPVVSLTRNEIEIIKNNIVNGVDNEKANMLSEKWKSRDMCIIMLGIATGLRVTALTNVDIGDIDFKKKKLKTIEKGEYERYIYLSDKIIEIINKWIEDRKVLIGTKTHDALFISNRGDRITPRSINNLISKYTYNIPKNITPHKLRSTAATNLYDMTGDIYLVADVLGHANIQNTKRYAKMSNKKRQFAAEKLADLL